MKIYVFNTLVHGTESSSVYTKVYTDFAEAKKELDLAHRIDLYEFKDEILEQEIATEPFVDTYTDDCTEYEFQMAENEYGCEWCHCTYSIKEFEI